MDAPPSSGPTAAVVSIRELEQRLMTAVQHRDMTTIDHLVGADFTLTTGRRGAEVRSRAEWLAVTADAYEITAFDFDELDVQLYHCCAIARSRYRQTARMGTQRRDGAYRMTDVWVRVGGAWTLQARHAQPLLPPPASGAPTRTR